jgi:ABC-type multidrug transport system ATPase subunit
LRASGVRVTRGGREVVSGVDLTLRAGEIVALLGPNGAGKSTLLAALAGAVELAGGSIDRDGRVAVAMQSPELARRTVRANVELALAWWGVPRGGERSERASRALAALGVAELAARRADSLSGGERRRVHIARALAVDPDVLLLDEPFAGLDPEARASLLADAAGVLRSSERATMIVVHDRGEAWALADRVVVLLDGRIAAEGRPRELLSSPPSAKVAHFLGFDGWALDGDEVLLTRPACVRIDPDGPLVGTVTGLLPMEDGVRVTITLTAATAAADSHSRGMLSAIAPYPAPELGAAVSVSLVGAARFPAADLAQLGPGYTPAPTRL